MAKAPTPGAAQRAEKAPPAPVTLRMTLRGKTLELVQNITTQEKFAVRYATGLPYDAFVANQHTIGEDTFIVFWWLARRQNGEPNLPFQQAMADWPTDLTEDDLEVVEVTEDEGDVESPEGSGPGSSD